MVTYRYISTNKVEPLLFYARKKKEAHISRYRLPGKKDALSKVIGFQDMSKIHESIEYDKSPEKRRKHEHDDHNLLILKTEN